jgi:uncharacterized protein YyaL (SSP411 family)
MLNNVKPEMVSYGSGYSNWLDLMLNYTNPFYEVAIVGEDAIIKTQEFSKQYLPNILIANSSKNSELPLLKNRFIDGKTYIYVCVNNTCKLPVTAVAEAIKLISK